MTDTAYDAAMTVLSRLRTAGHEAYFAGGCVRDLLLGLTPHDYDIATDARPDQVTALFAHTVTVGAHFGVVVVQQDGHDVEVATFRADGPYADGRHPSAVSFRSAAEDVQRRDFTINGLLYDPQTEQVIDHVGGQADLTARRLRCIGEPAARFGEDRLRLLRAVRFAVRFDLTVEPRTWEALTSMAPEVTQMSAERIRDELCKMLTGPRPGVALRWLHRAGLLAALLPELTALADVPQPPAYHPEGDALEHTFRVVEHLEAPPDLPPPRREALYWAALLHDVGKAETLETTPHLRFPRHGVVGAARAEAIARRLRLSRAQIDLVRTLVAEHDEFFQYATMRRATRLRFLRRPHFAELLALHRADRLGGNGDLRTWQRCREDRESLPPEVLRPPRLLDGSALLQLGVPAGPAVGRALRALEDAQLEGHVTTPSEAEAWVRDHVRRTLEEP